MISLTASSHRSSVFSSDAINPRIFRRSASHLLSLAFPTAARGESLRPLQAKKRAGSSKPRPRRRRKKLPAPDAEVADSTALESEIFDFMERSANPSRFPTKEELIAAGRMDLAEAIAAQGGWFTLGWDVNEKEGEKAEKESNSAAEESGSGLGQQDGRIFQQRFSGESRDSELEADSMAPSSSGRLQEMESAEDSGIEGILSRIKKERSLCYAVGSKEIEGYEGNLTQMREDNLWGLSADAAAAPSSGRSSSFTSTSFAPSKGLYNDTEGSQQNGNCSTFDGMGSSLKTEMWRTWSAQRAGLPQTEFEAAEIVPPQSRNQWTRDDRISNNVDITDEMYTVADSINEASNVWKEPSSGDQQSFQDQIRSRLQHLELELTSVLCLLRTNTDSALSNKGQGSSLEEMHKLSDALEFQETEIMKTRDKLRSTRAKLAVMEGKMALEIIEAQKMVQERQRRIDDAKKALCILRTACIVWPNHAKEVFLTGSFDGWTSQRRMERSSAGMFSLNLKLYPGRYEIKFIVDGLWETDPLRPITNNNGYENNLLIIS
eukprot:TRINITY_DN19832_c0_g1_i2.p1 TRINITY_DN19832_c0_g1~~TRINITY_DN19832_c0_g1_i2.p1  ORF type:complete len:548 (-),score=115.41 TRINITY_DN19832_c0_g1_i2:195-1838(-)